MKRSTLANNFLIVVVKWLIPREGVYNRQRLVSNVWWARKEWSLWYWPLQSKVFQPAHGWIYQLVMIEFHPLLQLVSKKNAENCYRMRSSITPNPGARWNLEGTKFGRRRNGKGMGARYERRTLWSFRCDHTPSFVSVLQIYALNWWGG